MHSSLEEVVSSRYSKRESIIFGYREGPHDYTKLLKSDLSDDHVFGYCDFKNVAIEG